VTTHESDSQPPRRTFPKSARLLSPADYDRVYRNRCSVADEGLILYARANDTAVTRLGVSVSRKVGNAVARNRWKRLLREAFRLTRHELPAGLDLIAIPRGAEPPALEGLCTSMRNLARRVGRRAQRS